MSYIVEAKSLDDAIQLAEREAFNYSSKIEGHQIVFTGLIQAFEVGLDRPRSGTEVFSLLRRPHLSSDVYLTKYFVLERSTNKTVEVAPMPAIVQIYSVGCYSSDLLESQ